MDGHRQSIHCRLAQGVPILVFDCVTAHNHKVSGSRAHSPPVCDYVPGVMRWGGNSHMDLVFPALSLFKIPASTNELIYKTKTDSDTENKLMVTNRER